VYGYFLAKHLVCFTGTRTDWRLLEAGIEVYEPFMRSGTMHIFAIMCYLHPTMKKLSTQTPIRSTSSFLAVTTIVIVVNKTPKPSSD
jgi:hypothetical protein